MNILTVSAIAAFALQSVYGDNSVDELVNHLKLKGIEGVVMEEETSKKFTNLSEFRWKCEESGIIFDTGNYVENNWFIDIILGRRKVLFDKWSSNMKDLEPHKVLYLDENEDRVESVRQGNYFGFNIPKLELATLAQVEAEYFKKETDESQKAVNILEEHKIKVVVVDLKWVDSPLTPFWANFIMKCIAKKIDVALLIKNTRDSYYVAFLNKTSNISKSADAELKMLVNEWLKYSNVLSSTYDVQVLANDGNSEIRDPSTAMQKIKESYKLDPGNILFLSSNVELLTMAQAWNWNTPSSFAVGPKTSKTSTAPTFISQMKKLFSRKRRTENKTRKNRKS